MNGDFDIKLPSEQAALAPIFGHYGFFNVPGKEENCHSGSYKNAMEVSCTVALVKLLCHAFDRVNFFGKIGIITGYKKQQKELKKAFVDEFGQGILKAIDINTVDAFQGQEKDIIIFSCVRTGSSIGFLTDARRMNVALTRAKSKVFILGHAGQLTKHVLWNNLIGDAKERDLFYKFNFDNLSKGIKIIPTVSFAEERQNAEVSDEAAAASKAPKKFVIQKPGALSQGNSRK